VPPDVPSVTQSSVPFTPSLASKISRPSASGRAARPNPMPALPGLMSLRSEVPASVPSVTHSSLPWVPSLARNSSRPSDSGLNQFGKLLTPKAGLMSLRSEVPAAVPSVTQRSAPADRLLAEKTKRPSGSRVKPEGAPPVTPGQMSARREVAPVVRSATQSSRPELPSVALKISFDIVRRPTQAFAQTSIYVHLSGNHFWLLPAGVDSFGPTRPLAPFAIAGNGERHAP
jgi:hypothetical protein